jgi:hypothetical protein
MEFSFCSLKIYIFKWFLTGERRRQMSYIYCKFLHERETTDGKKTLGLSQLYFFHHNERKMRFDG